MRRVKRRTILALLLCLVAIGTSLAGCAETAGTSTISVQSMETPGLITAAEASYTQTLTAHVGTLTQQVTELSGLWETRLGGIRWRAQLGDQIAQLRLALQTAEALAVPPRLAPVAQQLDQASTHIKIALESLEQDLDESPPLYTTRVQEELALAHTDLDSVRQLLDQFKTMHGAGDTTK